MPAVKFACPHCESQYTRRDSLRRHIKLHHRGRDLARLRAAAACAACKARKTRCSGAAPCDFCLERGVQCKYDDDEADDDDEQQQLQQQQPPTQRALSSNQWSPEIDQYVAAYFARFHPTWPFLHKASFSPRRELPFLVQAVVMVGLWAATPHERGARQAAVKLHEKMRASILEQQAKWDVSQQEQQQQQTPWPIGTCQAILLFLIFGSMLETRQHQDGDAAGPPPRPRSHTATDRAILVALVKSARKRGMFNYAKIVAQCSSSTTTTTTTSTTSTAAAAAAASSSALLCAWTAIEEAKRFAAALDQVWRLHGAFSPEDDDHDDDDEGDEEGGGGGDLQQMPAPDADFLWDASDEGDLLRRIGEERRRGARTGESEMQVLGTSWDDILREYVGAGG